MVLTAVAALPLLAACAGSGAGVLEARDPKVIHSDASSSDLVVCLKGRLNDEAKVIAYPEPGKVDIRIGDAGGTDSHYYHLIGLRPARTGTTVEIRSADEWHPMLSPNRVAGMVRDCKPGAAR
jgi:hypothetical protein